jgi:Starch-binding associating with outer membrane
MTMLNKLFRKNKGLPAILTVAAMLLIVASCKKGTFDINSPNPNLPSSVSPKFSLSAALKTTAGVMYNGNIDFMNTWMDYWAVSGDYTASPVYVTYTITSDNFAGNWDQAYINLNNYHLVETQGFTDPTLANYEAIAKLMKSFIYQRIVDLYNNAPYVEALSSTNFLPTYTNASDIYTDLLVQIDSAKLLISQGGAVAENPAEFDVMFGGDMDAWVKFANTLKLKILMRLTATNPSAASAGLAGMTTDDFLGAEEDAMVNPGYSAAADDQENPYYLNVGYTSTGANGTNNAYWRANKYAVDFYNNNNDPRATQFYAATVSGDIVGRYLGSTALEHNDNISGVNGLGNAAGPDQSAVVIGAFESLFLQAEAVQRGYITGDAQALYESAVAESFRLLGLDPSAAATYVSQAGNQLTNWAAQSDKLRLIITQKWAACNSYDPLESHSDYLRTGFPSNLPVSIFPGNTQTTIPSRILYPTSEHSYNEDNVNAQGTITINSKIFWQPQ